MAIGKLNLKLGVDVSNLDKELGKVERSMSRFGSKMQNVGTTLTQSLTLPIIGLGGAALKSFADMERLELGLTAIMGTSAAAKTELDKLRKTAENPGLALPQVVQASSTLQAVGLSADEARETIVQFGNATARAGKGAVVFDELIFAFTKISSTGSITQEVLNQLTERLPELSGILQETFGATTAEGINATGISAENFSKKTVEALANLGRAQGGLGNSFDNLKDNVAASLAELGKTINESLKLEEVIIKVSEKVQMLVDKFKSLTPQQQENIVKFGLIAAAIGPVILIIGQFATSISSIIALSRTLLTAFTFLTGGTALLVTAIGSLIVYYATTEKGQKMLKSTGELLYGTFKKIMSVFSGVFDLLVRMKPIFEVILGFMGLLVKITLEPLLWSFNKLLDLIIFVSKGASFLFDKLKEIGKTKVTPTIEVGFGGGKAGKPSGAGGSWGNDVKTDMVTTDSPEVAAMKAKIKALEDSLKNSTKTSTVKSKSLDKKLFEFDQYKTLGEIAKAKEELDRSVLTEVAPKIQQQLGFSNGALVTMKNAAADVLAFGQKLKENPPDFAKPFTDADAAAFALEEKIQSLAESFKSFKESVDNIINTTLNDLAISLGTEIGNALSGAGFSLRSFIGPLADALGQVGKLAIQTGIAAAGIKLALKPPINPAVAIAGGIALVALSSLVKNKLAAPALAEGGLAYGPTMATVGDNRNARVDPEVIAPLSKLKGMLDGGGSPYILTTRVAGSDLLVIMEKARNINSRIR